MIPGFRHLSIALSVLVLLAGEAQAQCDALKLDGVDDIASVLDLNNDFDMGFSMTLEAWYQVDFPQTGAGLIGGTAIGGGGAYVFGGGIGTPSDGVLSISVPNTDAVFAPGAMAAGGWQHMAGTYDGVTMTLYVNGVQAASSVHGTTGSSSDVESLVFGRFAVASSSLFFSGSMDELRIWNVVRTPAEILASYNVALAGNEPGLVGYYKFNEGSGDVILDSSINGNDGFLGATTGPGSDDPARVPSGIPFLACANPGIPFCFGDGSGTICPCGNNGAAGEGCANSTGSGAVLVAGGTESVGADDITFTMTQGPAGVPAIVFTGTQQASGGLGSVFGDGLLCAGGTIQRLNVEFLDASGSGTWGPGLQSQGGWVAGDTRHVQGWYRNVVGSPCSGDFNTSQGLTISFVP